MTRTELISTLILLGWQKVRFNTIRYEKDGNSINIFPIINQYSILRINGEIYRANSYKKAFQYILERSS